MNNLTQNYLVEGKFSIVLKDANGNIKQEVDWQKNLITDDGLRLLNGLSLKTNKNHNSDNSNIGINCVIGTSTVEPKPYDKELGSYFLSAKRSENATTGIEDVNSEHPNHVRKYFTKKYIFSNDKENANITELGLADVVRESENSYVLYTHALIKDSKGVPTSITVLKGEILEINYEISHYIDIRPKKGEFTLSIEKGDKVEKKIYEYVAQVTNVLDKLPEAGLFPMQRNYASYIAYGVNSAVDTDLDKAYDFSIWGKNQVNTSNEEVLTKIDKYTLGTNKAQTTGYYVSFDNWDYSSNYHFEINRNTTDYSYTVTSRFSPYALNFSSGIRAFLLPISSHSSVSTEVCSLLVVVAEKGSSKGLMKTIDDALDISVKTTVSRYMGDN